MCRLPWSTTRSPADVMSVTLREGNQHQRCNRHVLVHPGASDTSRYNRLPWGNQLLKVHPTTDVLVTLG